MCEVDAGGGGTIEIFLLWKIDKLGQAKIIMIILFQSINSEQTTLSVFVENRLHFLMLLLVMLRFDIQNYVNAFLQYYTKTDCK